MTKLPEKTLLSGTKTPTTTTGEMKNALGKLHDYLIELFGDDSGNKEGARQTLGIDLSTLAVKAETEASLLGKADKTAMETALAGKAGQSELDAMEEDIAKRGVPIGSIDTFAMATPPSGYLKADGAAVGRETYPELFAAIGTTFGEGDGETTFNLPDLMGRFAQGSTMPGRMVEAGLPNITGTMGAGIQYPGSFNGALYNSLIGGSKAPNADATSVGLGFDASRSNPIYGASDTVQPPALTLLPCIKAFGAIIDGGLLDVTALAGEMAGKLDKTMNGKVVRYVTDSFCNDTNWYRKWSDGWLEQGGILNVANMATVTYPLAFSRIASFMSAPYNQSTNAPADSNYLTANKEITLTSFCLHYRDSDTVEARSGLCSWSGCGWAA